MWLLTPLRSQCQKGKDANGSKKPASPGPAFPYQHPSAGPCSQSCSLGFPSRKHNCICHCPVWKPVMAPHYLLEKPQHLRQAELGLCDCSLSYLQHLSPHPICHVKVPAISCLCAFAYAVPSAWKAGPFFSKSHPLRRLNVTSSVKLSLNYPGSYLLCPLSFTCSRDSCSWSGLPCTIRL